MSQKINLKKISSLGLSLSLGLSMVSINSFASERFIMMGAPTRMFSPMDNDAISMFFEEARRSNEEENNIDGYSDVEEEEEEEEEEEQSEWLMICSKVISCLNHLGYEKGEITENRINLFIWNIARKFGINNEDLNIYFMLNSKENICGNITKTDIESFIDTYSREVVENTFLEFGIGIYNPDFCSLYNFCNIDEVDFQITKHIKNMDLNVGIICMSEIIPNLHRDAKLLLDQGFEMEKIDFIELNFKSLLEFLSDQNSDELIDMFYDLYIDEVRSYIKNIEDKGIILSETAEAYKNECLKFLRNYDN